jgi:hypothetical protein
MPKNVVEFADVKCKASTDKACLCDIDGEEVWIPLSQIDEDSEVWDYEDEGTLVITRWIAEQRGLV